MASMTLKIEDPLFNENDSLSPKKLKESIYLSFPVETVLSSDQRGPADMKTEFVYHLAESDRQCEKPAERTHQWSVASCCHELPEVLDRKDVAEMTVMDSSTDAPVS